MGPPKLLTMTFHMNDWSWFMLHNFLNPLKQATVGLRELQAHPLGFTWESLSLEQVAATSDCFTAQAGWPQAKHRGVLTMACITQEIPGQAHTVDS